MATSDNTFSESSIKGNKLRPFKTRGLHRSVISKLWPSKRAVLVVLLLASSATALASLGIRRAMQSGNNAAFVSQSVQATMTAGEAYPVTVTMLNEGTTTWTPGQAYRLGSQNPQDNTTWMTTTNRVNLLPGDSVSPGATTTFSFMVKAPGSPGSYNFQWRMVREGVEWFGATTPNIAVQVLPRPVSTKLKEYVYAGGRLISSEEKGCVPALIPDRAPLPQGGETRSFDVSLPPGCDWTATPSAGWITINSGSSGAGSGTVNYTVAANSGPQRVGTITVNGKSFTITQAPNLSTCSFSLDDPSEPFPQQGGDGVLSLNAGAGCEWNAVSSDASWLTASPTSGEGSAVGPVPINYSVTPNSGQQRTGSISIMAGGQTFATFTVIQAPNQASCTFALSPSSGQYPVGGGTGSFSVITGAGCTWAADTSYGWIPITAGATNPLGGGGGMVTFDVHANNGGSREGKITVKGKEFTVNQCGYVISPTSASFGSGAGSGSFTVSAAAGCSWSAVSNAPWIAITGQANGTVSFTVEANSGASRTGSILAGGRVFTITQCGFQVSPTSASFGPDGGTGSVTVSADCAWTAIATSWISITSGQSGVGNGIINYRVAAFNVQFVTRTGTIRVGNQVVTIDQAGIGTARPASTPTIKQMGMLQSPGSDAGPTATRPHLSAPGPWLASPFSRAGLVLLIACGVLALLLQIKRRQAHRRFTTSPANVVSSLRDQIASRLGELVRIAAAVSDKLQFVAVFGKRLLAGPSNKLNVAVFDKRLFAVASDKLQFVGHFLAAFSPIFKVVSRGGAVMRLGEQKLAGLAPERVRAVIGRALLSWRGFGLGRPKPILRRALAIAMIVILATPLSRTQADGLARAAQATWRAMSAYAGAAANPYGAMSYGDLTNRSVEATLGHPTGKAFSATAQAEQVAELQVCPQQLVMFAGERYTLTPVALDAGRQVVHGAAVSWNVIGPALVEVSSFGEVEAGTTAGNTVVVVQSGSVSKEIQIEVRSGTRPTGTNQQADLNPGDCSDEQASMFAPKSAAVAPPQQNLIGADGVMPDGDPLPEAGSRAAHFRNAVGNPRFSASNQSSAAVPTSTQLGSDNYQFNVPVVSVGGRGVSASIGMTFNSRVWNTDNGKITFNYVGAYPAPGWTMGFGKIIRNYNSTATGAGSGVGSGNSPGDYLLVAGDGTRVRLAAKYDAAKDKWFHESDDGSFLHFNPISGEMRHPDGSRTVYSSVNGVLLPTAMINTNGGAITMGYRDYCEGVCVRPFRHRTALSFVRDTRGRYVTFHYYGDLEYPVDANGKPAGELAAIKAPDKNGVQQEVIRVEYVAITLKYNFGGLAVDAPASGSQVQVVSRISYPQTGRGYLFQDYSSYGMPRKLSTRERMKGAAGITDGAEISYTTYNYTTISIDPLDPPYNRNQVGSLSDFPQFTRREEWWTGKTRADGTPATDPTSYVYSRTTNGATEETAIEYVDKNCIEVTTIGTDSSQLNFGKVISVERKKKQPAAVLSKQVFTYMTGPDGETEIKEVETFDETEQGRLVKFGYGSYGRVIDKYEYGYKQGTDYQVRRRIRFDYIDTQSYKDERFLRLVRLVSVYDALNNNNDLDDVLKAKTETFYDDYDAMGGLQYYNLTANDYPPNHDAKYNQSFVMRGNATAVKTFSSFSPEVKSVTRRVKYDIFGNVVEAEVSCCVKKSFIFTDETFYSQPRWVRSGGGTGLNLETSYQHNFYTGLVKEEMNPDGVLITYEYDDALRLTSVTNQNTEAVAETHFDHDNFGNDLLSYVSKTRYDDRGTQKVITSRHWFDGSGRAVRAGTGTGVTPDSYDTVATVYDGWGRQTKQSNPYLGDANGAGDAQFWTINTYDELSRVDTVTLPGTDNQTIQTEYRGATSTSGATVTTTDTVGRQRKSEVDGMDRLVKVTEQNPANGNLEWVTSYSYDVLNNLTQTDQGGQTRTFEYDAKSRLTRETTPEAGTTAYEYTDFDAVSKRTDARGVVTTYTYGSLNLLTGVSYNNVTGVAPTAPVIIDYRDASPGKGQLKTVTDGAGSESYDYDGLGRLESRERVIDDIRYETRYEYNAANQMTMMTYPSGKRVKVSRDARGRLSAMRSVDASNSVQETYLSEINYRVEGLISSQKLGDETTESFTYSDDRLQLTRQKVMKAGSTMLDLSYGYQAGAGQMGSGSRAGNSGQLVSITGTINGQNRNQTFNYDNVGRLVTATGLSGQPTEGTPWARRFDYDRYGNRTKVWDAVSGGNPLQNTMIRQANGMTTNRIESVNGTAFDYDASGNVTREGAREYTYDAENRLVSVNMPGGESYSYDTGNHRVKKVVGGVVTHYIWEDKVIAEYERGGINTEATGTRYYHQDSLSTRIITDDDGNVKGTTDHLPFGEEIGFTGESEKHKFTTYERDGILEYAVNRHYASHLGRFNQVDPLKMGAASLDDPQSLNLYNYVRNDPVNNTDPTGLFLPAKPPSGMLKMIPVERANRGRLPMPKFYRLLNTSEELRAIRDGGEPEPRGGGESEESADPEVEPQTQGGGEKKPPCPNVPLAPPDVSIDENIRTARRRGQAARGAYTAYRQGTWLIDQVKAGAPWDYKKYDKNYDPKTQHSIYEDFGNFNYGATGAALGLTSDQLERMAGRVQDPNAPDVGGEKAGWLDAHLGQGGKWPYGDQYGDNRQIRAGIGYYNRKFVKKDCQ